MTNVSRMLGVAVAALLIGCNKAEAPSADAANDSETPVTAAPADNVAATASTPAALPTGALSSDFLVGKWSAMGDCEATLEFRKDGTIETPIGGGKWSLTGDQLVVQVDGADKQTPSNVAKVDDKTIQVTRPGGQPKTQIRC